MRLLTLFILLPLVICLSPKKLPNGKPRLFKPNMSSPKDDLKLISPASASLITKNWISNIILDIKNNEKKKRNKYKDFLEFDDIHIFRNINKLDFLIMNTQKRLNNEWTNMVSNYNESMLIFAYNPKSLNGINEVLFLVIACLDRPNKILKIKNIIQSPFWDEEQINSIHLKNSLIHQNKDTNITQISFDELYEDNYRFRLAWETWYVEKDE
tara:strand:- start:920 stop:1555 length:636 start_codon:yes stop_codon:yes gene_type:complete